MTTAPTQEELDNDVWDGEYCLSYSQDGTKLLDAENFPDEVKVKDGCQVICDDVFSFQDYMADVRLGAKIPLEERSSFLEKIRLPESLTHIGSNAFAECGELLKVKLPRHLQYIGEQAFVDCWQLEKINLPASVTYIGPDAFLGCINLEEISIPKGCKDHFKALLPKRLHKYLKEK